MNADELTANERAFIKAMYADWESGRKFACWGMRAFVAIGAMGAAIAGIVAGIKALRGH